MKQIHQIFVIAIVAVFAFSSCEYDNYDAPSVSLSGKLTCDGQPFFCDGNPSKNVLKVFQKGFGKIDNGTSIRIDEDGNFKQLLFEGDYWLSLNNEQYPFEFSDFQSLGNGLGYDSIYFNLKSAKVMNLEVKPYFSITDFTVAVEEGNIVFRCNVRKNEGTREAAPRVIFGRAYLGTASKVNSATVCVKSKRAVISDSGSIEIMIPINGNAPSYRGSYTNNFRDYAFCRMSLELDGIKDNYLFSETKKLESIP